MTHLLTGSQSAKVPSVGKILKDHKIDIEAVPLDNDFNDSVTDKKWERIMVAFTDEDNPTFMWESLNRIRSILDRDDLFLICGAQSGSRQKLDKVHQITPENFKPATIADRILGYLFTDGFLLNGAGLGDIRGASLPMKKLFDEIKVLAGTPVSDPILIQGETGVGKELAIHQIHKNSPRSDEPIRILNCANLNRDHLAAELFGQERGAYTGAEASREGHFRAAGQGTAVLDEIGEMAPEVQAMLLRALQERLVQPLGTDKQAEIQCKIIFATHQNLAAMVNAGVFRRDLYERISGMTLYIPPLREHKADIPMLANYFLSEHNRETTAARSISEPTFDLLFRHNWPGNIRQLRAVIRNTASYTMDPNGFIDGMRIREELAKREAMDEDPTNNGNHISFDPSSESWREFEYRVGHTWFNALLQVAAGNKTKAMKMADLSRATFYDKLAKFGISKK